MPRRLFLRSLSSVRSRTSLFSSSGPKKLKRTKKGAAKGNTAKLNETGIMMMQVGNIITDKTGTLLDKFFFIPTSYNSFIGFCPEVVSRVLEDFSLSELSVFKPKPEHMEAMMAAQLMTEIDLNLTVANRNNAQKDAHLDKGIKVQNSSVGKYDLRGFTSMQAFNSYFQFNDIIRSSVKYERRAWPLEIPSGITNHQKPG